MNISRRKFLKRAGWTAGGVTVLGYAGYSVVPPLPTFAKSKEVDIVTWVQLMPNGHFRYYLSRAELGQGISTSLSQVVAEELNIPVALVDCHYQSTEHMAPCQMTVGSQSIENFLELTAKSAAYLRHTLQDQAAVLLQDDPSNLESIEGGFRSSSGKSISYEDLLNTKTNIVLTLPDDSDVPLFTNRAPSQLKVVGKHVDPANIMRVVTGTETYSRDVHLPDMRYGAIARPPQLGATIKSFDRDAAIAQSGVIAVVEHDTQLGIVAVTPMAAAQGLISLNTQWHELNQQQLSDAQRSLDIDDFIEQDKLDHTPIEFGAMDSAQAQTSKELSFRYDSPMIAHAALEPRSGVASWRSDENGEANCEVWTGCQDPWLVRSAIAKSLGVNKKHITVHNQRVGGAFGGRVLCQASVEAAWLSKAVGQAVKVQWTREEEFRHNYVGPQFSARISAGLDAEGHITYFKHQTVGAPILTSSMLIPPFLHWGVDLVVDPGTKRGVEIPYDIQNHRVELADERVPMPTGPWRGLGAAPNTFAVESAMDELSRAAGLNPITFRLNHLSNSRLAHCLNRLKERIGDRAQSMGIAAAAYKGDTFVAIAVDVELQKQGFSVKQVVCVHDCGRIISPDQVRAQIEGNVVWGIGMALHEQFALDNGIAATDNFNSYTIPRHSHVPDIEVDMIDSDHAPSGAAEAAVAPVAAAIANAVYARSGTRYRQLPIMKHERAA